MSCDWDVRCVTCGDNHGFHDANHCEDLMLSLCKRAEAIAALVPLIATSRYGEIELRVGSYGAVDVRWFARHAGHQLSPVDEYGRLLNQCQNYVACGECSTQHHCKLDKDHAGPCSHKTTE